MRRNLSTTGGKILWAVGLLLGVCLVWGCGTSEDVKRHRVVGQVTLDGAPMEKGLITFVPLAPTKGPKATGTIDQGQYVIEKTIGPYAGNFQVKVETVSYEIEAMATGKPTPPRESRKPRPGVAKSFNQESQLRATVVADSENQFDFDVQSRK